MSDILFQAFTVKAPGLANRLIIRDVGVSEPYDQNNLPDPLPPVARFNALWDTGATNSVIKPKIVKALGLTPSGSVNVNHGGGKDTSLAYIVNMHLPNRVCVTGVTVIENSKLIETDFDIIIGMDIIKLGDMAITNVGGKTCMSFRTPSIQTIDYVQEANRLVYKHVGRNDLCPCGSVHPDGNRKKYKNCCEGKIII